MIFEFGISVHEKLRHFIIVMEKYTKNDGNQNFNGFNKVHEKNISSNQITSNFFSKGVTFTKFLPKKCETQCGKYGILLPHSVTVWKNEKFSLT